MKRLTVLCLTLALVFCFSASVQAQDDAPAGPTDNPRFVDENGDGINDNTHRRGRPGGRRGGQKAPRGTELTDEQKAAIKETVDQLKAGEATQEEIRAAVRDQLTGFGIEVPSREEIEAQRTETQAQREAVRILVDGLREEGAAHDEIKAAVDQHREDNGIEAPEGQGGRGKRGRSGGR